MAHKDKKDNLDKCIQQKQSSSILTRKKQKQSPSSSPSSTAMLTSKKSPTVNPSSTAMLANETSNIGSIRASTIMNKTSTTVVTSAKNTETKGTSTVVVIPQSKISTTAIMNPKTSGKTASTALIIQAKQSRAQLSKISVSNGPFGMKSNKQKQQTYTPEGIATPASNILGNVGVSEILSSELGAVTTVLANKGYEVTGKIGSGTYAKVYKLRNIKTNKEVAVKIIDLTKTSENYRVRFLPREMKII